MPDTARSLFLVLGVDVILERNEKHAEALTLFFVKMLVMDLVSATQAFEVWAFCVSEPFKTLVDEYVMHQKISHTVNSYTYSNIKLDIVPVQLAK